MNSVSVIIPTYNRKGSLLRTLDSLRQQTYPSDRLEVIIVDDGSTDGTEEIAAEAFPFALLYFWQRNQGDAAARNFGARQSQADFLVFLDDDILAEPGYLTHLIHAHEMCQNKVVVGTWNLWPAETTPFSQTLSTSLASDQNQTIIELPFRDVYSNNMSLRREAYFKIGMMQGLDFSGSSMWCDLDFTYRAYRQDFEFRRSTRAVCWHRDYSARTLDIHKKRMRTAAFRAVVLFQKYPELLAHLPMFYDKTPISWGQDPPHLIARKLARSVASSGPALWSMEQIVTALEKHYSASTILASLYRYIIGGYIFRGYREGLGEFGRVGAQD
jgi:glycosyltransferase involved in cell wall biosynthesis